MTITPAFQKLIFIDAEKAFDVFHVNDIDRTDADPRHIAEMVRAIQCVCRQDVKVVFMVHDLASSDDKKNFAEFSKKETQLSGFFYSNKDIVSQLPPEKTITRNLYANILRNSGVTSENALFVTPDAQEVDPLVIEAGIGIMQAGSRKGMWTSLKEFALR